MWSTGEGNGNPLQHSCLGNPMDMGFFMGFHGWMDFFPPLGTNFLIHAFLHSFDLSIFIKVKIYIIKQFTILTILNTIIHGHQLHFHCCTKRSYPTSEVGVVAERSNPTSKEWWLCGRRRAERSYSTFSVRKGDLVQGKEQRLCFAGAAMKRYPTSTVRETQVRW